MLTSRIGAADFVGFDVGQGTLDGVRVPKTAFIRKRRERCAEAVGSISKLWPTQRRIVDVNAGAFGSGACVTCLARWLSNNAGDYGEPITLSY